MRHYILIFFMVFSTFLQAKTSICLNMIVKNETRVICRCIDSVKELIDYWVIVDTGSTDGTQELIKKHMKKLDIPGELHERPWKDFGHNRTEALQLATGKGDYFLFMDADDWLEYPEYFTIPKLTADIYLVAYTQNKFSYLKGNLVKASLPWVWEGVLHEYLTCHREISSEVLEEVYYVIGNDGSSYDDPDKYYKHALVFEKELKKNPHDTRSAFYCGQSYRDAHMPKEALKWYQKRAKMGGWPEEVYCSLLQAGLLQEQLESAEDTVINAYYKAHRYRPHRAEAPYFLAQYYNQHSKPEMAYATIKAFWTLPKPKNKDLLFTYDWIEEYGLLFQFSIASYWAGQHVESIIACDRLLEIEDLPEEWREQTKTNRTFPVVKLKEQSDASGSFATVTSGKEYQKIADDGSVLLAILAKNKEHVLPMYLKCLENLDYNKDLITIYINTNDNIDATSDILQMWKMDHQHEYREIIFVQNDRGVRDANPHEWTTERFKLLGSIRNESMRMAQEKECEYYFVVDCDNFIASHTLKTLIAKDKPIIAPMLRAFPEPLDWYSNFFCAVDETGYYRHHPDYEKILHRQKVGTFQVPVVHCTYLIKTEYITDLNYIDETPHHEFVVFSKEARDHQVAQFICNEKRFGLLIHFNEDRNLHSWTIANEKACINSYIDNCKDFAELEMIDWPHAA